jgi:uridylate kinase
MKKPQTIIISLGGSIIVQDEINVKFLKDFKRLILKYVKRGKKFVIVTGGGKTARDYQNAAKQISKLSRARLDWIGIYATHLNACLVKEIFEDKAVGIITDLEKPINTKKPIIIGAGTKPGWSTDYDAAVLAKYYKAKTIINLSNIDYVYDKDPNKFKNAKPLKNLSWKDFLKIICKKWKAGLNSPFDPIASRLSQKLGLKVIMLKGTNLKNLEKFLDGEKFNGTVIR